MSAHRFFLISPLPERSGAPVTAPLDDADLHHAVDVLRVKAGEEIELVEPQGSRGWRVRVVSATRQALLVEPVGPLEFHDGPRIVLFQGLAKGEKMDSIVRQAVELGAHAIAPVLTEHTVVRLDARKRAQRTERWRKIAKAAAEQAHRERIPEVRDPVPLAAVVPEFGDYDAVVVLWEGWRGPGLVRVLEPLSGRVGVRVALVVGPEGGLSATEVDRLTDGGATPATLGPTILRTETAASAALVLAGHALDPDASPDE